MMPPLQPPNTMHLQAATGWLELGNHLEADAELDKITLSLRAHSDVLDVRWAIYAVANKWEAAVDVADAIMQLELEHERGWQRRSYALHELKRTVEARDNLLFAAENFPFSAGVRSDLACYECCLGRLKQAKQRLQEVYERGDAKELRLQALDDPDLEPLWREIGTI
jgi:hypothetical protein